MNNNGFTKRNVFIGDVQITEDLTCGDMVCQEMTLTGDINLDNKDIIGVDNIEVKTINGGAILSNPLTATLDLNGNSIINNPEIDGVIQKTQYITAVEEFQETQFSAGILVNGLISNTSEISFANGSTITGVDADLVINSTGIGNISSMSSITTTGDMTCATINADAVNIPAVTTLETKTQYQSVNVPLNSTVFSGIVNATTTLSVGTAQSGQTGYNLPLSRPLSAGFVMVTPASTGNTLTFQIAADPNKILNQTSIANVSTTFNGQIIVGNSGVRYTFPNVRGTDGQYLVSDSVGILSWVSFLPTYAQIARQLTETAGYLVIANSLYTAQLLGGTVDTTLSNSSDITVNIANGALNYTGPPRVLRVEASLRARTSDNKSSNGIFSLYLLAGTPALTISRDNARFETVQGRTYLSCSAVNLFPTNTQFTFAISYDTTLTTNSLFLSSISLNVYGVST